jgi:translocation and assembly module TamB
MVDEEVNGRKPPAPPERLQMALELDLGKRTPIRGEGLKAKIGGRLEILKEPGRQLRVIGEVDFKEGLYARFGRRFIIQRGKVAFSGQEKPDPTLNIAATTRVNSVDIDLGIGGTVKKPDYILSSRPVMDREEILAYLIFGQSAGGSSQAENGRLETRTIGILGGPATELVKGIVSERLAPDSMTVSASNKGGVALEAGKQLLPNLFFSYVAYSEPTKPNEFKIEYRFSPNVAVESNLGDPETAGVDINFKYDF